MNMIGTGPPHHDSDLDPVGRPSTVAVVVVLVMILLSSGWTQRHGTAAMRFVVAVAPWLLLILGGLPLYLQARWNAPNANDLVAALIYVVVAFGFGLDSFCGPGSSCRRSGVFATLIAGTVLARAAAGIHIFSHKDMWMADVAVILFVAFWLPAVFVVNRRVRIF